MGAPKDHRNDYAFDRAELIDAVKRKPCLWDINCEEYKDKAMKVKAWSDICEELDDRYFTLDEFERKLIVEAVQNKWKNIRDAFLRTLRKRADQPEIKKYLYAKQLKFLEHILLKEDTHRPSSESSFKIETVENPLSRNEESEEEDASSSEIVQARSTQVSLSMQRMQRKRKASIVFVDPDEPDAEKRSETATQRCQTQNMSENESFFDSILSTVNGFDEDETLEFRIGVLAMIKSIKTKRSHKVDSNKKF